MKPMCPAPDTYTPPPDGDLPVVHLDEHFIALDKPSGLLSVPGKGQALADCLEARVQARHPAALTVHRLDRDTSGLVVMAMNPQSSVTSDCNSNGASLPRPTLPSSQA
jgi:tRNA pseudouridine32 synthase/23S rRNA pseudouridine746 synthase